MPKYNNINSGPIDKIVKNLFPEASSLRLQLARKLTEFEEKAAVNHLQSKTRNLALYISSLIQDGQTSLSGINELIRLLTVNSFLFRANKLRDYIGECSLKDNEESLTKLFESKTHDSSGSLIPFKEFKKVVETEIFGIVITAHPTFSISKQLTHILAELVIRGKKDERSSEESENLLNNKNFSELIEEVATRPHGSPTLITLEDETDFALMAINNIRKALRNVYRILFTVSKQAYPKDWYYLTPKLLTVATWVGYDLDGRADIGWKTTFKQRMIIQKLALEDYLKCLEQLENLESIKDRIRSSIAILNDDLIRFDDEDDNSERIAAFSRALIENIENRLIDLGATIEELSKEIGKDEDNAILLAILRSEMANFGLAFAHTHVRLNANQIANSIRHDTELTSSPEDPANRRRYLRNISNLLESVEPVSINFGSIMRERTSAKRLLMIVTQFLKFVDTTEPIRFLIAECNSAFTVLSTLYFAKLFGIDKKIDIAPLFETSHALEQGHEIIAELLDNPQYLETILSRGRICLQTGYSDAGRYIGQIPASLALERTRIKLSQLLSERGLKDIELVIFDTHGESIGRGSHPLNFTDRLDYTYPPADRAAFRDAGITIKQELSFQGGDGYVYFANTNLAFSTLCRLLHHSLTETSYGLDKKSGVDPFYTDKSYSLDFFLSVKGFNERLMDNPDYAVTLDLFGLNLLFSTGSRNMKRQHIDGGQVDLEHPSQVRAIPHNAILQQLGYMSNTISGLGDAIAKDQDSFNEMFHKSNRFKGLISMVAYARHLSDLDRLHGYISLFDPTIWIRRSTVENNPERVRQMQRLTHILRHSSRHEKMNRIYRIFLNDTVKLDQALENLEINSHLPEYANDCFPDLVILHGIRIALIHEIFLLIARMPRFTSLARSADDVINELLHLNIKHGVNILRQAFPITEAISDPSTFGEPETYRTDADQGYDREHRELFEPIENLYDMVRRVSTAITHINNGVG